MSAVAFLEQHATPFFLIFVRCTGIFLMTPIFSVSEIPLSVKGGIAVFLALVIYPVASPFMVAPPALDLLFALNVIDQILIGILIGLILQVYYTAFLLAGEFFSLQMGFGIVNVIDPLSETSIPILGQIKSMFALMVFTIIQGHHMVIEALVYSFRVLPGIGLGKASMQALSAGMILATREMFGIAFQIGAPIIATVFLIELVMGIMSKIAPQMNVMEMGFQIKTVVGLSLMAFLLPIVYDTAQNVFSTSFRVIHGLLRNLA